MNSAAQRRRFYFYAIFLTSFAAQYDGWTLAQIEAQTWLQWAVDAASILASCFIADRAFLDQSISRATIPVAPTSNQPESPK